MIDVIRDVEETFKLNENSRFNDFYKYSPIYPYSNEGLSILFSALNLEEKELLSVAGSGDHALYAYHNGAKNVDLFDIDVLSKYYYYFRMWVIKYLNVFYFDDLIDEEEKNYIKSKCNNIDKVSSIINNTYSIKKETELFKYLLSQVKPVSDDEKMAYEYWEMVLKKSITMWKSGIGYFFRNILCRGDTNKKNNLSDLTVIKRRISNNNFIFYNFDIYEENLKISKKYDVLFVSNILEYATYRNEVNIFKNNVYNLLNDDGILVLSNVRDELHYVKRLLLKDLFTFEEDLPTYENISGSIIPAGNILRKK